MTVYAGWQDNGRDQQSYTLSYSTVSAPGTFLPLTTVNFNPAGVPATNPTLNRVIISESSLPQLATNVAALRFDFLNTENVYAGYAEIDAVGAAVPEPGTVGLLVTAFTGLLIFGRRRGT